MWNFFLWDFHKLYFFSVCNFTSLTCLKHSSLCTAQNASWCNFLKILLQNFMHASKNIRKLNFFMDVLKIAHKFNELFMGETVSACIKCHEKIIAFSASSFVIFLMLIMSLCKQLDFWHLLLVHYISLQIYRCNCNQEGMTVFN